MEKAIYGWKIRERAEGLSAWGSDLRSGYRDRSELRRGPEPTGWWLQTCSRWFPYFNGVFLRLGVADRGIAPKIVFKTKWRLTQEWDCYQQTSLKGIISSSIGFFFSLAVCVDGSSCPRLSSKMEQNSIWHPTNIQWGPNEQKRGEKWFGAGPKRHLTSRQVWWGVMFTSSALNLLLTIPLSLSLLYIG